MAYFVIFRANFAIYVPGGLELVFEALVIAPDAKRCIIPSWIQRLRCVSVHGRVHGLSLSERS